MLYPLLLRPIYKNYIWGGNRIPLLFQRSPNEKPIAESWELSAHQDGMSQVENGPLKGTSLAQLMRTEKKALMGKHTDLKAFPLLVKLIDAQEDLSIQVHPFKGEETKNECWIVLDAEQTSVVYAGFKTVHSKEEVAQKLSTSEIISLMQTIPAKKGAVFWIPGGRLHGIGRGCVIFEVQQSSNTTYRVYDWGRGRTCHLEQAKEVICSSDIEDPCMAPKWIKKTAYYSQIELIRTPFFIVEKWLLYGTQPWNKKEDQFEILFSLNGFNSLVPLGRTCLLPAKCPPLTIENKGCAFLRIYLP